jgi:glycosyltransferase involved in cell wall biosynthesis
MKPARQDAMRVAITTPTNWPYVRRGMERFCNELAAYLARQGHRVTLVTAKPGRSQRIDDRGFTTVTHRRLWHPALANIGVLEFHPFAITALASLLNGSYDVVVSSTFIDAFAATLARRVTGVSCVFVVNGLPPRISYVRSITMRGAVFGHAMRNADEVVAISSFMQDNLQRRFGRRGIRMPVPVDTDIFRLSRHRVHEPPVILCTAALTDARKGGRFLMKAFDALKASRPDAILHLSSQVSDQIRSELLACVSTRWRSNVHFLGAGELADLPSLYGSAAISVLPSRWEPFGLVILESLATGTPVVATCEGAIPELISNSSVGCLFHPGREHTVEPNNLDGLVQAMVKGLELSRKPETADRCRAHAEQFSWAALGPQYENLLRQVAAKPRASERIAG